MLLNMLKKPKPQRKRNPAKRRTPAKYSSADPVLSSMRAILRPFDVPKGMASPLDDGRPSQKFMAKAQAQISLASGQIMAFMFTPCAANNSTYASLAYCVGAQTGGNFTSTQPWSAGFPPGAVSILTTNTPYSESVLSDGIEISCVGAGLKFTYEGTELNRGGTFRYIYDREGAYNVDAVNWALVSPSQLVTYVNSQANTIRQSINKDNVVEINASLEESDYREVNDGNNVWFGIDKSTHGAAVGITATPAGLAAVKPAVIGYFVNPSTNAISFHVDLVEHWAMAGSAIQTLQTESYAHASMAVHVNSVMSSIRQAHASTPNVNHASVATTTVKALKSPIGHELLNAGIMAALA